MLPCNGLSYISGQKECKIVRDSNTFVLTNSKNCNTEIASMETHKKRVKMKMKMLKDEIVKFKSQSYLALISLKLYANG